ncbi:MAG TPA: BTAD domain-containing putative transcriptional regulator [Gemmatimonadaceae bacterium]|nr:BTAD domain-containing putative transcriptional regulator [Gemmatimonadaceae bacterium]
MLSLCLFGGISLSDPVRGIPARANQRRQLALLAVISAPAAKPYTRDKLGALLWPEATSEHARRLLSDTIYVLRTALGDDVVLTTGENVSINVDRLQVDVVEFTRAMEKRDYRKAVEIRNGGGPFLDGARLLDSSELERWAEVTRSDLDAAYRDALRQIAGAASSAGDWPGAVGWWRRLAGQDPLSESVALELLRALDATGDRSGALAFARVYERLVRSELDSVPDPSIVAIVDRLRRGEAIRPGATSSVADQRIPESPATPRWRTTAAWAASLLIVLAFAASAVWRARSPASGLPTPVVTQSAPAGWTIAASTKNAAAYDLYLRARHDLEMRNDTGFRAAVADYRAAIGLDSTFADAYAGLSESYSLLLGSGPYDGYPSRETARAAESTALKAISLADSRAPGHLALGLVRMTGRMNFAESERELLRARALDPADPDPRGFLITLYDWTGRPDEALREARAAVSADPLSMGALRELARALYFARRYEEELIDVDRMRTIAPVRAATLMAAETYDIEGRYDAAMRELAHGPSEYAEAIRGYTLARMGNRAAADSVLRDLVDRWRRGKTGAFEVAIVYLGERDLDRTFRWIDRSFDDMSFRGEIMDPLYDDLRADPRFAAVARRIGLTGSGLPQLSRGL